MSLSAADAPVRKQVSRRRVRSVMQDLIYLACRICETCKALEAILWEALPMAHNMAAYISSIRTCIIDHRSNQFREIAEEHRLIRTIALRG